MPTELIVDGKSINDPKEIADSFNEYFTSIGQMLTSHTSQTDTLQFGKRVCDTDLFELPILNESYVRKIIEKNVKWKSSGTLWDKSAHA